MTGETNMAPASLPAVIPRAELPYPLVTAEPGPTALWAQADLEAPVLEQYRLLRTRIVRCLPPPSVLAISSACAADGKSTTAVNLAGLLAIRGSRVALVDCDLRRSSVSDLLGLPATPGLLSVLEGGPVEAAMVRVSTIPNLAVLPAGRGRRNPAELLDAPAWPALIARLRGEFDYVVCDTAPVAGLANFWLVENVADATALVVRPGHTERGVLDEVLQQIAPEKFLGVVINEARDWFFWKKRSYYRYYGTGDNK